MKIRFTNFDEMFDEKKVITNKIAIDDNKKTYNPDGIFSEVIFGKLSSETMQYTCKCGNLRGKFQLGEKCPECDTVVTFTESSIKIMGWIDFGEGNYVINPNFYYILTKIISKSVLDKIISYNVKLDKDGLVKRTEEEKEKYFNIGLKKFKEKFDEILDYYYKKSNGKYKDSAYRLINKNKDKLFISKFPVFSHNLRPATMMNNSFTFDEVNNMFNSIIASSNLVKEATLIEDKELSILPMLKEIQLSVNQVYNKVIENIKGKRGFIRNNIMGTRVNFSARNVITPLPSGYKIDEVVLPYLTFLELYRFHIINILSTVKGVSINRANHLWFDAMTEFNEEVYGIMKELVNNTKGGLRILLNRNPTINFGSILYLSIAGVKKDYNDLTLSLHNNILGLLAGDYDGDVLNIIPLLDNSMKDCFKIFSPKKMFIDNNDGKFNYSLNICRDQMLGMYSFNQ